MNRGMAAVLLLLALPARAASVCDGPCSIAMAFPAGGSIGAPDGATITFGPEGGLLALGEGGAITLGEGGGVSYLEGGPADMSQGGTVQLGPGGSIAFGNGGSLATGNEGGISLPDGGAFDIETSGAVTVDSPGKAFIGDVDIGGDVSYTGNTITQDDPAVVGFNVHGSGADSDVTVTAGGDLRIGMLSSMGSSITLTSTGGFGDGGGGAGGGGSGGSGGVCVTTGPGPSEGCDGSPGGGGFVLYPVTLNPNTTSGGIDDFRVSNSDNAAGAMGVFGLLAMALAALGRRRR